MSDTEQHKKTLKRGEFNVKNIRLIFQWGSILAVLMFGCFYLFQLGSSLLISAKLRALMIEHSRASIGIPLSIICATALVMVFEQYSGEIQLKMPGFELKGAAGPLILWGVSFLFIVAGISMLW